MNEFDRRSNRVEAARANTSQYSEKDISARRPPIILGAGEAPVTAARSSHGAELTTADIAGKQHEDTVASTAPATETDQSTGPLFNSGETADFRSRWDSIQAGFVDEPRRAVEQADNLVAATIKRLAEVFADERQHLEQQWMRGESVSTEDLRLALRRYRSFFGRLLSV